MDLVEHLKRQMAFSKATFGPGERRKGVIEHIRKELVEVEQGDPEEWVDVVILALDGLWRSLHYGKHEPVVDEYDSVVDFAGVPWGAVAFEAVQLIEDKQECNEERDWPDWRIMSEDQPIEHVRD